MMVPILVRTAGVEGAWSFTPIAAHDGAAILVIRFARPGGVDLVCHYGVVFIFDLLDGLMARGDFAAATEAARAAVRALELKHAARRLAEAAKEFPIVEEARTASTAPAGAGLPDLPPAGDPLSEPQPGNGPVGGYAGAAVAGGGA